MNHQYRKKPVVVEAFQMTKARRVDNSEWPNWLNAAWNDESVCGIAADGTDRITLTTLEGTMTVAWDDFIICGIQGEIYPCKPEIFKASYEKVE